MSNICITYDRIFEKVYSIMFTSSTDTMFFTILLGFLTLLFVLHCFVRYGRVGKISNQIPGPKAYPIIGNLYHFQLDNG